MCVLVFSFKSSVTETKEDKGMSKKERERETNSMITNSEKSIDVLVVEERNLNRALHCNQMIIHERMNTDIDEE